MCICLLCMEKHIAQKHFLLQIHKAYIPRKGAAFLNFGQDAVFDT